MKFKILLFLVLFAFFIIDDSTAKFFGSRGGGRISSGGGRRGGSSSRTSYSGSSRGSSSSSVSRPTSVSSRGSHNVPSSPSHTSGKVSSPKSNVNTQFLAAEGGGATRPVSQTPAHSSVSGSSLAVPSSGINRRPGTVSESMQGKPSAPVEPVMKPSGSTVQNQGYPTGQVRPPWGNPNVNQPVVPGQTYPSWGNPSLNNKPTSPVSQPPIGFEQHVNRPNQSPYPSGRPPYPVGHPHHPAATTSYPARNFSYPGAHLSHSSGNTPYPSGHSSYQTGHASYPGGYPSYPGGHPSYPSGHPSYPSGHPSYPSGHPSYPSAPIHPSNSVPLGNPYSMHPPGPSYNAPGQTYYPQQPHVFAQPAAQPFVPGQTVLMMPAQQDSGRGFGQMVKEALVFSTINAGVNRLINPHTHHYVESRPQETAPSTSTHITYNYQYFNGTPGSNEPANPINVPPGTVPITNAPSGYVPTPGVNNLSNAGVNNVPNAGINNVPNAEVNNMSNTRVNNVRSNNDPNPEDENVFTPSGVRSSGGTNSADTNSRTHRTRTSSGRHEPTTTTARPNTSSNSNNSSGNPNDFDSSYFYISDKELFYITEELFSKQSTNLSKYIKLNLQTRVSPSTNVTDEAKEPLFNVEPELYEHPTIYMTKSLYDNYEYDYRKKIKRTMEMRKQEDLLMDTFLHTDVMSTAMNWLADRGFIDPDDFERKDVLRRIWFTVFSGSSCGFERVFASESYDTAIVGVQDWIYFAHQESLKRIDYMGYVDKLDFGDNASLLKLNFQMDGIVRPNATIFVGTSPELEMSLYTICFYARSNNLCPVSLGGTKFNIYTHSFVYFGNEILDLGLPMF